MKQESAICRLYPKLRPEPVIDCRNHVVCPATDALENNYAYNCDEEEDDRVLRKSRTQLGTQFSEQLPMFSVHYFSLTNSSSPSQSKYTTFIENCQLIRLILFETILDASI